MVWKALIIQHLLYDTNHPPFGSSVVIFCDDISMKVCTVLYISQCTEFGLVSYSVSVQSCLYQCYFGKTPILNATTYNKTTLQKQKHTVPWGSFSKGLLVCKRSCMYKSGPAAESFVNFYACGILIYISDLWPWKCKTYL